MRGDEPGVSAAERMASITVPPGFRQTRKEQSGPELREPICLARAKKKVSAKHRARMQTGRTGPIRVMQVGCTSTVESAERLP